MALAQSPDLDTRNRQQQTRDQTDKAVTEHRRTDTTSEVDSGQRFIKPLWVVKGQHTDFYDLNDLFLTGNVI